MTELPLEQEYAALLAACTNYKRRAEAAEAAIAQAVQAEREACAKVAGQAVMRVKTSTQKAHDMTLAEFRSICSCAAEDAIRARNGG